MWANRVRAHGRRRGGGGRRSSGSSGRDVAVLAPKLLLGEPMGAGGSLTTALALKGWEHGASAGPVLVNSLSLGGTNFSVVLAPPS